MIVLHWIRRLPYSLKTFVANRVAAIQEATEGHKWKYVPSADNPADAASRGLTPSQIIDNPLWWQGPSWLRLDEDHWPQTPIQLTEQSRQQIDSELRPNRIIAAAGGAILPEIRIADTLLVDHTSSFGKLSRITAYVMRFIRNAKTIQQKRNHGPLSINEQLLAANFWARHAQQSSFMVERNAVTNGRNLPNTSKLVQLKPFLDSEDLLRVGGRISKAEIRYDAKHPIILPHSAKITELIIMEAHKITLHAGTQLCIHFIRQRYWIPALRRLVKTVIHKCLNCFRQKHETGNQLMGELPQSRLTPARPFKRSGVEYAGPFKIKARGGRCKIIEKGYIAVFVCLVTKAVHLEVVSSLSSESFIHAFVRFIGRRGHCSLLMSDHGTNFIGADRELRGYIRSWAKTTALNEIASMGTVWQFISPAAPHQGGLWEAAVKAMKHHIRRVTTDQIFTFEGWSTLAVQIESILNSRPLTAISDDPHDISALTPGHFLIGEPLVQPLLKDVEHTTINNRKLLDAIQRLNQSFWRRWSDEYIVGLHKRSKWPHTQPNAKVGQLVLVKNELSPPASWPLARITKLLPGSDGLVRNVEVILGKNSKLVRPIQKLCFLPHQPTEDDFQSVGAYSNGGRCIKST